MQLALIDITIMSSDTLSHLEQVVIAEVQEQGEAQELLRALSLCDETQRADLLSLFQEDVSLVRRVSDNLQAKLALLGAGREEHFEAVLKAEIAEASALNETER